MRAQSLLCEPIFLGGSLQFFADVREANIIHSASVSRRSSTEGGSTGVGNTKQMAGPPAVCAAARDVPAAAAFNLDACFKMGEGIER